ncbi:MAG TPA: hypothetical protein VIV60_36605 [Polyangiaceae bacterium]
MSTEVPRGTKLIIEGRQRIYFDGYWIKTYDVPSDSLLTKKRLIEALTRRLFNHVEHGLNVPGSRLEEARAAYDAETDPKRKRVKAGMLAGALFNRAADVFTKLVELQSLGVVVQPDNALMRQCGEHLQEALVLGKSVLHCSGEEGIDELWGEPFKAFAYPIEDFYKSRYVKIAMTMRAIDVIGEALISTLGDMRMFSGIEGLVLSFTSAARAKVETLRTDTDIFEVWTSFAVAGELLCEFQPQLFARVGPTEQHWSLEGMKLVHAGKKLIDNITRARVPMPKSTREFVQRCEQYRADCAAILAHDRGVA